MQIEYWILFFHVFPEYKLFWKVNGRVKRANGDFDKAERFETRDEAESFLKDLADFGHDVSKWTPVPVINGKARLDFSETLAIPDQI